jgi:hypothetical protein
MAKTNDDPKEQKENKEGQEPKKKEGSNKTIVFILLGVIIILLLVIVIILLLQKKGGQSDPGIARQDGSTREVATGSIRAIANEEDARNVMDEMREAVAEGMFACNMSMTWNFVNGGAISRDAFVANDPDNTHPICFDVYLEGTDELIYSSPVLRVGTTWTDFSLDKTLEPGTYEAKVAYTLLKDEESQEAISKANFIITINVLD